MTPPHRGRTDRVMVATSGRLQVAMDTNEAIDVDVDQSLLFTTETRRDGSQSSLLGIMVGSMAESPTMSLVERGTG